MYPSHNRSRTAVRSIPALIVAFVILHCNADIVRAQWSEWSASRFTVGAAGICSVPVTEGDDVNPSFGLRGFLLYGVSDLFALEFGGAYLPYVDRQRDYDQLDVEGTAIPVDLRARFLPWGGGTVGPYLFAGVGVTMFDADNPETHLSPLHDHGSLSGTYVHIPVGIGATFRLSYNWGIDLQAGNNLGLSDGLNPNLDGTNDHLWVGTAGLVYRFGSTETLDDLLTKTMLPGKDTMAVKEPDIDADGLSDRVEIEKYHSDPAKPDTDGDGLNDGDEVRNYRTDPGRADTDGDGLNDGDEVLKYRTNPLKVDTDDDGLTDRAEVLTFKTDPMRDDTDGDGFIDGDEVKKYRTDPLKPD